MKFLFGLLFLTQVLFVFPYPQCTPLQEGVPYRIDSVSFPPLTLEPIGDFIYTGMDSQGPWVLTETCPRSQVYTLTDTSSGKCLTQVSLDGSSVTPDLAVLECVPNWVQQQFQILCKRDNVWTIKAMDNCKFLEAQKPLPIPQTEPSLYIVLDNLNERHQLITDLIPNLYLFSDGEIGFQIFDGGNDMYDGGNLLNTNIGGPILYSNQVILPNPLLGTNGLYFTAKHPGLFVFAADTAITDFQITGNLGADGFGTTNDLVLTEVINGITYKGFVKRTFGTSDPSVNHLIIVQDNGAVTHTFATNTDNDLHSVSSLTGVTRLYYLLFASSTGGLVPDDTIKEIMRTFMLEIGSSTESFVLLKKERYNYPPQQWRFEVDMIEEQLNSSVEPAAARIEAVKKEEKKR